MGEGEIMKKVIGGKSKSCDLCGGTMLIIKVKGEIFNQCVDCGALTKGTSLKEVTIIKD